jgi:hypothetical protein
VRVGGRLGPLRHRSGHAELGFGGTDRGGLRVGVDHVWDGLIVGLARLAEDVRRDHLALVLAHVGQQPDAGDVADRPQPLARMQVRVDCDAVRAGGDADRVQAGGRPRAPAGGGEQMVAAQLTAVFQGQDVVRAVAPRGGRGHAQDQLDAVGAQHLAQCVAQWCGLAGQHVPGRLDQGDLAAQPAHGLGHLGAHRPATQDQQPARDGLHAGHLAVGPHAVQLAQARDGRYDRV